ncbi:SOS response-associated peptidase family protein [uncultured Imperialibacter sp.]|uniref:SOS response-associated peptidase family protein n=1 Tax=uncultured Imperialibacter sp. TaxID=1672639 RepID=UPI0030DA82C4
MCGQLGYFSERMTRDDWADAREDMKHLQEILDSTPVTKTYHNPTGSRCWAILQEDPGEMIQAQFGYYHEYKGKLSWRFNVRSEGGFHNQSEDPNYDGPWEIFTNPFAREQIIKRRCVVPANFFVEQPLGGKPKKKFIIRKKTAEVEYPAFFLGAIYDWITDKETGEHYPGFSLITTAAAPIMKPVLHPRSPLVIPPKLVCDWLDPQLTEDQIISFFGPFDSSGFETFEVDTVIAKKKLPIPEDDESLITPISEIYPG